MAFTYELAGPQDDLELRSIVRRLPVPGAISLSYQREPNYFEGCAAHGHLCQTVVARRQGKVAALACRAARKLYLNGEPTTVGYLGQLRVVPGVNGLPVLLRGFDFFRELHCRSPLEHYLTTIISDNRKARALLVDKPRRSQPRYRSLGEIHCLTFPTRGRAAPGVGTVDSAERLLDFLHRHGSRRQFFPCLTPDSLNGLTGPHLEDFLSTEGGVLAVWDQTRFKQTVVESYSGGMAWVRPLLNGLVGGLPPPGSQLRLGYAACLCLADPEAFEPLLQTALSRARHRGLDYLVLGLHQSDPLLPRARKWFHIPYRSELFSVSFGEEESRFDDRVPYLEIATL